MSFPYCKFANEDNKYDKTLKMKNNTMIIACLCAVGIMNVSMLHVHENMQGTTRTRSYKKWWLREHGMKRTYGICR